MLHIISVGGSIIVPNKINTTFLKKFKALILKQVKKGHKFILLPGGGHTCRLYDKAAKEITKPKNLDLDYLGIGSTALNAQLLKTIFKDHANQELLTEPKKLIFRKPIQIAIGIKPGHSSDYDAVQYAIKNKTNTVLNLTNVDYICTKDPKKYKSAKPLKQLKKQEYFKYIGNWKSGGHYPFDPKATKEAKKQQIIILKGTNLKNLENYFNNKPFKGSVLI